MFGLSEEKIAKWGQQKKVDKLVKAASNPNGTFRLAAIKAMGNVDDDKATNALITALRDREPAIRMSAIDALLKLNKKVAIEHVRSLVSDADTTVSEKAREALKTMAQGK